jgi:predicted nucleic acid-binding protein
VILLDTSGLLAAIDASENGHAAAARSLARAEPRILSPFVLAELDYLLATRVGQAAELALLAEVARGAYALEAFNAQDVEVARALIEQYHDLHLGLADASIVVLALRYGCYDILTFDERHFRVILGPGGRPLRILPRDASGDE